MNESLGLKNIAGDKVVVLVVQKQDTNKELINIQQTSPHIRTSEQISPQENGNNAEELQNYQSKLDIPVKTQEPFDHKTQLIQQSKQIVNYLDLVSKPGVEMLHMDVGLNSKKKPRPQTSKVKVDIAKQLYKIPSISKCLEFEILPKNQTLLKNMYSNMAPGGNHGQNIHNDYLLNVKSSAKKSKTRMNF